MTEHHAISRRAFTLGLGLAALSPLASLPETAAPGIPLRAAFADNTPAPSVSLDNFVIRLRPAGYFRTASVNQDGNVRGNVCHLFNDGTSSKLILENVTTKNDDTNWYAIRTLLNFEEHKKTGYSIWSVDDDSDKDGKVIHVWGGEYDNKPSRAFAFERQSNGTYIIRDRTVEKETEKKDIKYLAIESNGKDQDNNKICHKSKSIPWELELVGYDMGKINTTVRSIDWTTYSSYVDGPCWMKYVDDNKYLDELSIPGTHDSGTCSVDNDTEPQSSQAKCQQDYIPTQLLEGIRYFDIRLGRNDENGDPGIDHGRCYLLKKDGGFMHLSNVIDYFKTFLNENPSEALIMLASRGNDEATDESVTTAFAKVMHDNPNLFYTSSHVPTLGEVRGKIVLLRRFGLAGNSVSGHTWGLDLTQWDDKIKAHSGQSMCLVQDARGFEAIGETGNEEPYCTKVYAQDKYKLTGTDKLSWVDNALKETTGRTCNKVDVVDDAGAEVQVQERCWSINYTSCTGLSHGGNPFTSARVVNEHLYKSPYINPSGTEDTKSDYLKHIGIIASDFVDAALARSIYQRNYNYDTKHTQSASCCLPTRMRMTYGDSLSDASLQDGKTVGEGHFRLVDSSNVLNVAASGHAFTIEYVDVDALGNETVTGLQGSVPIDIDPRALTPHFEGLEGLKAGEDVRTKVAALLEGKLENDACTAQLEFVHDADGAPGTAMVEGEAFTAETYWVRANGLLGDAAQNYKLANDGAASFTVAASSSAGGTGTDGGTGSNAGSADKNGKGNKGKNSGGKLADTGDGSGIAAGLAAAAVATTVAGAAMLANDRENAGDGSE